VPPIPPGPVPRAERIRIIHASIVARTWTPAHKHALREAWGIGHSTMAADLGAATAALAFDGPEVEAQRHQAIGVVSDLRDKATTAGDFRGAIVAQTYLDKLTGVAAVPPRIASVTVDADAIEGAEPRVEYVVRLMLAGSWRVFGSYGDLAAAWSIPIAAVAEIAAAAEAFILRTPGLGAPALARIRVTSGLQEEAEKPTGGPGDEADYDQPTSLEEMERAAHSDLATIARIRARDAREQGGQLPAHDEPAHDEPAPPVPLSGSQVDTAPAAPVAHAASALPPATLDASRAALLAELGADVLATLAAAATSAGLTVEAVVRGVFAIRAAETDVADPAVNVALDLPNESILAVDALRGRW
jgi:hypothetical protein